MVLFVALALAAASPAEEAAIFKAAGFTRAGDKWRTECDQADSGAYEPGRIDTYGDLNGDGRPEALVTEGGSFCYGNTGAGFWLLSKQSDDQWVKLYQSQGIAEFLPTLGASGLPDISVGGPGFCFPVVRWNGKSFAFNRNEYEGKACKPPE